MASGNPKGDDNALPFLTSETLMSLQNLLSELQLLRNDPSLAPRLMEYANRGEVDAQYALGLVYAEGRGVPVDLARAHMWLCRAADQGDQDAVLLRNTVGAQMSDEELSTSQRLRRGPTLTLVEK